MNVNGEVSFGQPWNSNLPQPFPQPVPIIAPFWAEFQFYCGDGDVLYRQTTSSSIRAKVASDIKSHLSLHKSFDPSLVVIVTWNETHYVEYYDYNCYDNKVNVYLTLVSIYRHLNTLYYFQSVLSSICSC